MKVLSKLIPVLIIVIPIIICVATLQNLNEDYEEANNEVQNGLSSSGDDLIISQGNKTSGDIIEEITAEMGGEQYTSKIGAPISKLYTDASIKISVANVYTEADETSEVAGTLEKYAVITAQKYPSGWTRIMNDSVSGWMRTENISFPETTGNTTLNTEDTPVGKTGKIKADPWLNVRASANSSSSVITTIPNGTEITIKDVVNGSNGDWYKVTYASSTGWVSANYVVLN